MIYSANDTKVQNYLLSLNVKQATKNNCYNINLNMKQNDYKI